MKKTKNIDPALVGEWRANNTRLFYSSDGFIFFGDIAIPITISNSGNNLHYGSDYFRVPGTPNSGTIVGDWRSDEQGENKYFHADGSCFIRFDNESQAYYGTYSVTGSILTNLECRAEYEVIGNEIVVDAFGLPVEKVKYNIQGNVLKLTAADGTVSQYNKWP